MFGCEDGDITSLFRVTNATFGVPTVDWLVFSGTECAFGRNLNFGLGINFPNGTRSSDIWSSGFEVLLATNRGIYEYDGTWDHSIDGDYFAVWGFESGEVIAVGASGSISVAGIAPVGPPLGDFDGDGMVGQGDLDLVLLHWGQVLADPEAVGWTTNLLDGRVDWPIKIPSEGRIEGNTAAIAVAYLLRQFRRPHCGSSCCRHPIRDHKARSPLRPLAGRRPLAERTTAWRRTMN